MAVDHDVIHRQVNRMFAIGPFQLVGAALQLLRAVQRFRHIDHIGALICLGGFFAGLADA